MQALRLFLDTHDHARGTFPEALPLAEFEAFYEQYEQACRAEDVIPIRTFVGAGRGFCLNLASDADAVRRAHARVGLPFDEIVEVTAASPADTFFRRRSAA